MMDIVNDLRGHMAKYYDNIVEIIPKVLLALVLVGLLMTILKYLRKKSVKFVLEQAEDKLLIGFIDSIFRIVNISIGLLVFLFTIGQDEMASNVLGAATISSVVIGFAFKDIAENFLAGIIMAFNRPFSIGDTIMTGAVEGTITEMSLRDTHIKTFDGKDVYVPNSQIIKTPLYNYTTDGHLRKSFDIGLEYGTDIEATRSIILDAVNTTPGILQEERSATTLIKNLGASTINIQVQYWVNTFNKQYTTEEINSQAIKKTLTALESAQINLPQ